MTKWILFCGLLVSSLVQVASACSCWQGTTLEQKYQRADHILVAKISGCAPDKLLHDGRCRAHGWTFETVENLKGSDARVPPPEAGEAVTTCDLQLKVGDTYLLFLSEGRTYQCSGTGSLSDRGGAFRQSEVEILRAYRDGAMTKIFDPWHFADSGWDCSIGHTLDGGVHARFGYTYAAPPAVRQQAALPKPIPALSVRLPGAFQPAGPMHLEINGDSIALSRNNVSVPNSPGFAVDFLQGDAALAVLDKLLEPSTLDITGNRSLHGSATEPFRATTNTAHIGDAATQFKACIAAHPAPN